MLDVEVAAKAGSQVVEHRARIRPALHHHMGGDDVDPARDRPHVEIVNVEHAAAGENVLAQSVDVHIARRRFEKNIESLVQQAERPGHDQRDDQECRERVGELAAAKNVRKRRDDHGNRGRDVREDVEVRRAHGERGMRVAQQEDGHAVADQANRRHGEDQTALDLGRLAEPTDALDEHDRGDDQQQHRVENGRKYFQPEKAESPAIGDRTRPQPQRHEGDAERDHVDEYVEGLGEQGQAAREDGRGRLDNEDGNGERQRDEQTRALPGSVMHGVNGTIHVRSPRGLEAPLLAQISHDMTISSVVERWPDAARIFARYGLSCASCSISKSETIMAGATGHGGGRVNVEDLMRDLNTYADSGKLPDNLPAANATAGAAGMKMRGMAEQKGIKHVIAVMSGKGGVGKSLVAGLLAVGLKRRGFRVGVLDGDITGPSIPRMFGVREKPVSSDGKTLNPPKSRGGIPIMSMNLLLPEEGEAVIWRGPMVSGAIRQFFSDVNWGELDYLIVDLPPGTSDAPLTVMQALPVDGVVLVTTPQALAAMVVTKAVKLVKQLGGDILGIVENMAYVRVPDGSTIEVFGPSQGLKLVIASNAPLIAKLPIDPEIARLADAGLIESYESPESEELIVNFLERAPEKHPQVPVA